MDSHEYSSKLKELDHLFNDPDAPIEPERLWTLLAELVHHDLNPAPAALRRVG